jgi:hypothetical protein
MNNKTFVGKLARKSLKAKISKKIMNIKKSFLDKVKT